MAMLRKAKCIKLILQSNHNPLQTIRAGDISIQALIVFIYNTYTAAKCYA